MKMTTIQTDATTAEQINAKYDSIAARAQRGGHQLLVLELRDAPHPLLVVRELDPVAPARDLVEEVPVVMQRGVDVERYPGHLRVP